MEKHKNLTDQMLEVETNLDRWQSAKLLAVMNVLDGNELDEQDW